ncbi:olfactory receptor 2G3-like [Mantella aurantiaca]
MEENSGNNTLQKDFYILAFTKYVQLKAVVFFVVLIIYLVSVLGNLIIITLVGLVPQLHTPMYFFLCNLSVLDITYVSSILPKLLNITLSGDTFISFQGCFTQMSVFALCIDTYFLLLASMAYDRYVAICKALHYYIIMNRRTCILLTVISWLLGALNSLMCSILVSKLIFCSSHEVNHFFCDLKTMMKLSCSDTTSLETIISSEGVFWGMLPLALILISYGYIISTIMKIHTTQGRLKTFSSCSSHITVVIIYCVTILILYMKPESKDSMEQDKIISLLYVALVPMLNPLVYSLRNNEVLKAIKKVSGKIILK